MSVTRFIFFLLFGVTASFADSSAAVAMTQPEPLNTGAVDSYVEEYLDRHGLVGAEVGVVRDGRVVYTAGYGYANGGAATSRTPMAVASVSKPITAFAVLQLVDAGKVGLDVPVAEYLPRFEIDDERASDITVRQLLSHTSGLPSPTIVPPANDLAAGVQRMRNWQLAAEPGKRYRYSNMNYHLAARLVEVVTGTAFASYLEKQVFQPLGMDETRSVSTTRAADPGLPDGHVTAYGLALPVHDMEQMVAGAGGVVTTAEDMSRWLAMITNRGKLPGGEQLLSPELLHEAQSPQPGADGNGLGWHISGPDVEPARLGHSGVSVGYSAQIDVIPSSGYAVVVMLNSYTPTYEHNYAISSGIIEITEGGTPSIGTPIATLIDIGLGLVTLIVLALTALGLRRGRRWAARRSSWPGWRYAARLVPQLVFPVLAVLWFLVMPNLADNSAIMLDAFALWPAGMVLLLALAVSGILLIAARLHGRAAERPGSFEPLPA